MPDSAISRLIAARLPSSACRLDTGNIRGKRMPCCCRLRSTCASTPSSSSSLGRQIGRIDDEKHLIQFELILHAAELHQELTVGLREA